MTKARAGVLTVVVALLMAIQRWGLEVQPETIAEAPMKRVAGLPASDVLPTYIASLFFGAFRAVAVDILWIQLRKVEEEKRWYERREILKLISFVQPRNPEVWANLGWHSAYNVANGFTDPKDSWEWVKFGLLWLRKGITVLPNEPYLKDQLAYTLWHKAAWRDGALDTALLQRFEQDAELQAALLPDGVKADRTRSMFEIAILWLDLARDELLTRDYQLTQMGLYLYPDSMDGFSRMCMVMQGMYDWKRERREDAKAWFLRARTRCEDMISRTPDAPPRPGFELRYKNNLSSIFKDWITMYGKYPELVDLEAKLHVPKPKPEDELALLKELQALFMAYGPIDEQWFWSRYNPHCLLNSLKMKVCKGEDTQEFNDTIETATNTREREQILANLAPERMDIDYYFLNVPAPEVPPGQEPELKPLKPVTLTLTLTRPPTATLPLKISIVDAARHPLHDEVVKDKTTIVLKFPEYGRYGMKVEAAPVDGPWPPDTRYQFQYVLER